MLTLKPRIYVVCLDAYLRMDRIYGVWINATQPVFLMERTIELMLLHSPIEQGKNWAIHCTHDFGKHSVRKNDSLEKIYEMACFIVEKGQIGLSCLDDCEGNLELAKEFMQVLGISGIS